MAQPFDDPAISDDDGLVRFVPPWHVIKDDNLGRLRPTSAAFDMSPEDGCMSVDLEKLLLQASLEPCHGLASRPAGFGAVRLLAGVVRSVQLATFQDPVPENPYHGQIANLVMPGRIARGKKRTLCKSSEWLAIPKA